MPSHIDIRRGRWQEAVVAYEKAIAADTAYRKTVDPAGFLWHLDGPQQSHAGLRRRHAGRKPEGHDSDPGDCSATIPQEISARAVSGDDRRLPRDALRTPPAIRPLGRNAGRAAAADPTFSHRDGPVALRPRRGLRRQEDRFPRPRPNKRRSSTCKKHSPRTSTFRKNDGR